MMTREAPPNDEGFTQVTGAPAALQESIPAQPLVAISYAFIWLVVLLYLVFIWRRGSQTQREVDDLRKKIEAAAKGAR
jgi:CcmD family protein